MAALPKAAGIYCRLSYAPDGSLEKVERQEADCREVAARLGWPVSEEHIFPDNNRSAWQRNRKRPQWDRMLAAIEAGEIDAIVVYHGDRLIRQPYDLEKLLNITDSKGVRIASPSGTRNLDNSDDRFVLRIEAAQACRASDDTSRRVLRGLESRAKKGKAKPGGKRAFGFEADAETRRESECEVIAESVDRLMSGQSRGGILRWMNSVSCTTEGNEWTLRGLTNVWKASRIAGLVYQSGVYYRAVWEPIISPETWEALKLLLAQSAEDYPAPGRERKYLLTGVATCETKHRLFPKPAGGRNRKTTRLYYCRVKGCPTSVGRNIALLDAYVEGRVLALLNDPDFIEEIMTAAPSVAKEIAELEVRKAAVVTQIEDLVDHPDLDAGLLMKSLAGFNRKVKQLQDSAAMSERRRLLRRVAGISRDEWDELPIDVRTSVVRATYKVTVLPTTKRGPGFDTSAVRMERVPVADEAAKPKKAKRTKTK
ncbi:recombinase family protein [Actinomadura hibisca]|uniref:recombinase family protein n=1 Tax=Actinomadura hibisca TaxID=68565 RepID=UPI00082A7528|nr:recombinase family protein [Actinomadura hibisca]